MNETILTLMVGYPYEKAQPLISGEVKNTVTLLMLLRRKGIATYVVSAPTVWERNKRKNAPSIYDPKIYYTGSGIGYGVVFYLSRAIKMIKPTMNALKSSDAKIVHCHSPIQVLVAKISSALIGRYSDNKIFVTAHGTYMPELLADLSGKSIKSKLRYLNGVIQNRIDRFCFSLADKIIVTSDFQRKEMSQLYKISDESKIVRIYNPAACYFDNKKFRKRVLNSDQDNYILFVGRFVKKKGLLFLVDIMSHLKDKYNIKLKIVGGGMEDSSLMREVSERIDYLNLGNDISIHREVSELNLAKLYRDARILLVPSEGYESIPTVVIEGRKAGLNVISTNDWGIPEVDSNPRALASEREINEWIAKISYLIDAHCPDSISVIPEEFNCNYISNKYLNIFKS